MDPAAIQELQRLYAKKYRSSETKPSKRQKVADSANSISESDHDGISTLDGRSAPEVAHLGSEEEQASEESDLRSSLPAEIIVFDQSSIIAPRAGAVQGYKSFMSGKVPKTGQSIAKTAERSKRSADDSSEDSEDDLKKDKELQRLLRDSHLLKEQGGDTLETTGKTRHKAIAAQLVSNGASRQKQRKMPIGMRKGIEAAGAKKVEATEKFNRENGIVTARKAAPVIKKKSNKTLHELNVGKYKNGKLTITRREIDRINGPKQSTKGKKRRGFRDFSNIG